MPTLLQMIREYVWTVGSYWWVIVPGALMPLRDVFNVLKRLGNTPRWIELAVVFACLSVAQFLAYRNAVRNLYVVIEEKSQFSIKINDLNQQLAEVQKKLAALSPPPESPVSLRHRTIKAAHDLELFVSGRWNNPNRPQIVNPPPPNQAVSDEERKAIKKWQDYQQATMDMYVREYRDNLVSIALAYKNKGIPIGFLDVDFERGPPVLYLPGQVGQGDWGDDIAQLRNLAYRVDAYDNIITIP